MTSTGAKISQAAKATGGTRKYSDEEIKAEVTKAKAAYEAANKAFQGMGYTKSSDPAAIAKIVAEQRFAERRFYALTNKNKRVVQSAMNGKLWKKIPGYDLPTLTQMYAETEARIAKAKAAYNSKQ